MLKFFSVGLLGIAATWGGQVLYQLTAKQTTENHKDKAAEPHLQQLKTEMTGIPVVADGIVTGYLVFQTSNTIDYSKLPDPEMDVAPYILDAAIRASYDKAGSGLQEFKGSFFKQLSDLIREEANKSLGHDAVSTVNIEQFNFVPKSDIRGKVNPEDH